MQISSKQKGVTLLVALVALLVISILGMAALRSSSTDARLATNLQAKNLTFEAAQSAINVVVKKAEVKNAKDDYSELVQRLKDSHATSIVTYCITNTGSIEDKCSPEQYLDGAKKISSEAQIMMTGKMQRESGWSLSSPMAFGRSEIIVVGEGKMEAPDVKSVNVQYLGIFGPMSQSNLELDND